MFKKTLSAMCAAAMVVSMFGVCSTVLADDDNNYSITFDPNGGSGTMDAQTMPVGVKTPLNANKFEYKVNVTYDTAGGTPINTDVLEYPFQGWTSMSQVTETATNMGFWSIRFPNNVQVSHNDETGVDTVTVESQSYTWEKANSEAIYLEPQADYKLSIKYRMDEDLKHLSAGNPDENMRFTVMSDVSNGNNDPSQYTLGKFIYETEATDADVWHEGVLTFKTPESGVVYLSTNYGNLSDGRTYKIMYKDMEIIKVNIKDDEITPVPEALFYTDGAEVANIGESKDGIFEFKATWDMDKSVALPKPVKSCSVFAGWTDGNKTYAAGDKISPTEDIKLTALWESELIHDWGDAEYKWSDDNSTCTAQRVCNNDPAHVETETVDSVKSAVKCTCTEDGLFIFTAKFTNPSFTEQETESLDEPATGHDWGEWKDTKAATTQAEGEQTRTCSACGITETRSVPKLIPAPTAKPTEPAKEDDVTLTLDKTKVNIICGKNDTLKATLKGAEGNITWKTSDKKIATVDANGKVTAKMAGTVTVTASAAGKTAECEVTVLYKDVTNIKDFWYAPTNYLTAAGVVKGYDKQTNFKPANMCTRAQMVTFIWRLMGEPAPKTKTCKFKDVKEKDYFYKACIWGNENHIVEGYKDGTFGPQIVCARKHAVTFLWRLAGQPKPASTKNKFKDVKEKDYFYKATLWASEKGILAGYSDGTFKPDGDCLRRQMVTFLYKYDKFVNGKG